MKSGMMFSSLLHAGIILFSLIVWPVIRDDLPPLPAPTIVDVVPISDITNLPPMPGKQVSKPLPKEPEIEKVELPKPPPPQEQPKAEPVAAAIPEKPKDATKDPLKAEPAKKPEVKPQESDFESVLKTVEKFKSAPSGAEAPETPAETKSHAEGQPFIESLPISISEMDAVRRQIEACWNLPAGARDPESLIVQVWVALNPDGTVQQAKVVDGAGRAGYDPFYRAAAESALRALLNPRCSPLKLPADKYHQWKTMTINFDPRNMLGY